MSGQTGTYREAEEYINSIPKFSGRNSIEDTQKFLEHLGNPTQNCKIIHIAGTNGKGSVCAYLCSVFREAHILAGMFTSPHLVTMRERMAVDGSLATEEEFMAAFDFISDKLSALPPELAESSYRPNFYEFLFFMAMVYFKRKGVEYIVLETGLGGRLDATNAVPDKNLCIITSIGYDHMEYLGDTLPMIAEEKAGIMCCGVPVIYPVIQTEVSKKLEECAVRVGAQIVPILPEAIKEIKIKNKTIDFSLQLNYYDYIGFTVSTSAVYQIGNAALAIKALEHLNDERITVPILQAGIRKMVWEGRMEEVLPSVYVDGAHNVDGIRAFLKTVKSQPCSGKRRLLFSVVSDKQYQSMIDEIALSGVFDEIGVVALENMRTLPLYVLEDSFRQYTGLICKTYSDLCMAFEELALKKNDEDITYIAGSLYLVGEIKALLRRPRHDKF